MCTMQEYWRKRARRCGVWAIACQLRNLGFTVEQAHYLLVAPLTPSIHQGVQGVRNYHARNVSAEQADRAIKNWIDHALPQQFNEHELAEELELDLVGKLRAGGL